MDSLTQIVLGAACGEVVLGKKIGNKALLFGAIGGTIPDLDVMIGSLLNGNEIDAMLFHRGFMHSIVFAIIAAIALGWVTFKIYNTKNRVGQTTQRDWVLLYFWALFTHPILDCFTPYGTQLFAPFSNYRIAFNTIAVADVLYTIPFLLCMIVIMFYKRSHSRRRLWLKLGLGISSAYMLFTIVNKIYIDSVFKDSLSDNNLEYSRFSAQPTILNNILWYGIAETESDYQVAFYSLLDSSNRFSEWMVIPKQRLTDSRFEKDLACLSWFSNGFYNIEETSEGDYKYFDLRYPMIHTKEGYKPVFNLDLYESNNRLDMKPFEPETEDLKFTMMALWTRLKGI